MEPTVDLTPQPPTYRPCGVCMALVRVVDMPAHDAWHMAVGK